MWLFHRRVNNNTNVINNDFNRTSTLGVTLGRLTFCFSFMLLFQDIVCRVVQFNANILSLYKKNKIIGFLRGIEPIAIKFKPSRATEPLLCHIYNIFSNIILLQSCIYKYHYILFKYWKESKKISGEVPT